MDISSLLQTSSLYNTTSVSGSTGTSGVQNTKAELYKTLSQQQDSFSFSTEGLTRSKMPPPPKEVDFSSMSDEDLTNFLQQIQEKTGSIPGVEEGTSVSDLTSEQLQSIRERLTDMTAHMGEGKMGGMRGMGGMQGPPPMDIQNMSNDDLTSLLENMKEKTGSIPGLEDSESSDVSSLTDEQLQSVRDALTEMMQERMEKMTQSMAMSRGISAYENTGVQL